MNGLLARLVQDVTVFDGRPVISLCRCDPACVISLVMAAMVTVCVRCHGDCVCCHGDCVCCHGDCVCVAMVTVCVAMVTVCVCVCV